MIEIFQIALTSFLAIVFGKFLLAFVFAIIVFAINFIIIARNKSK